MSKYERGDRVVVNSGNVKGEAGTVVARSARTQSLTVKLDMPNDRERVVNVMPYEVQREGVWKQTHPQVAPTGKIHWRAGFPLGRAACGAGYGDTIVRMTEVQSEVTCKLCRVHLGLDTQPKRTSSSKPRTPPVRGVRASAQAFCKACDWYGGHWYGVGSWGNAAAELAWHKEKAGCDKAD